MNSIGKWLFVNNDLLDLETFSDVSISQYNSVYEVFRVNNGKPIFLKEHLDRLQNSLNHLNSDISFDYKDIETRIHKLIEYNKISSGNLKIEVFDEKDSHLLLIYFVPHSYPEKKLYITGVNVKSFAIERADPHIKQSKINNYVREQIANAKRESDAYEIALINMNGQITEGSRSNILFTLKNAIYTAPKEQILEGITRKIVLDLATKNNITVIERPIEYGEIRDFEGCFITGTSPKILPIRQIDDIIFAPLHKTIQKLMQAFDVLLDS